jgi:hypothetical protein
MPGSPTNIIWIMSCYIDWDKYFKNNELHLGLVDLHSLLESYYLQILDRNWLMITNYVMDNVFKHIKILQIKKYNI